jgi:hypothetical protein
MPSSSSDHILNGRTRPLTPAPWTLAVWQPVLPPALLAPTHPASPLQCDHEARGYRCAWGHILESVAPPDPEFAEGLRMWDVVLADAQAQYQALGGTLEELADMALVFLDTSMPHHAPRWLSSGDGVQPAAFSVLVPATDLPSARLLAAVLAINARAGHAWRPATHRCAPPAGASRTGGGAS